MIRSGESRTTNDGQQVTLAPTQGAAVDAAAVAATIPSGNDVVDCPAVLRCESRPAPYEQYGSTPSQYGNHDIADRPKDGLSIDYIVIHDTEASWQTSLDLVDDPTYLAWHYTIRSSDGQVAQHVNPKNVGFQAGNWYINMHSIGIEHEGFAATGASWYTESMYRSSATLVKYLSEEYGVPLRPGPRHRARPGPRHHQGHHPGHALGPGPLLGLGALHGARSARRCSPTVAGRATS